MAGILGVPIGTYDLQIKLSESDRNELKEKMYQNTLHIAKQDEVLQLAKDIYKDETAMQKKENTRYLMELRQGYIEKTMKAQEDIDYETAEKVYFSAETGEEVARVPMTREEMRELKIDFRPHRKTVTNE